MWGLRFLKALLSEGMWGLQLRGDWERPIVCSMDGKMVRREVFINREVVGWAVLARPLIFFNRASEGWAVLAFGLFLTTQPGAGCGSRSTRGFLFLTAPP